MYPRMSTNDPRDGRLSDAIMLGEFRNVSPFAGIGSPDETYVTFSKSSHSVALALSQFGMQMTRMADTVGSPTLGFSFSDVVELRPEMKVRRPNARRVITRMENQESGLDRTVGQFPRPPMGRRRTSIDDGSPVAVSAFRSRPFPALITIRRGFGDPIPERNGLVAHVHKYTGRV